MKKIISIILLCSVFISVTGFTVPCTLHCLHMEMDDHKEMCDHTADSDMDCNGSCMVNKVSDGNQNNADTTRTNDMLLTQYRVNLLSSDTGFKKNILNPLKLETYFNTTYISMYTAWIPDPLVPPPKMLPIT